MPHFHPMKPEKSLADQFASFFSNKIKNIRDNFTPSSTEDNVHPPSDPPKITGQVSEETFDKIIKTAPTKSCLLDPLPTFLIKECIDIHTSWHIRLAIQV